MFTYNIYTQEQIDQLLINPSEVAGDNMSIGTTYAINRGFDERTIAYDEQKGPFYIGYKTYDWRNACNVLYISKRLANKDDMYDYFSNMDRCSSINKINLPIQILRHFLYKKEKINMEPFSAVVNEQDINQLDYDKINKETLSTFDLNYIAKLITVFDVSQPQGRESVKKFIIGLCKRHAHGKSKSEELCQMKDIIRNYVLLFKTKQEQSEAAWLCVETVENNFRKKDSIICRKIMSELFVFVAWYTRESTNSKGLIKLEQERDAYLLNMYFKYKVNTWYCRSLIMESIDLIKSWDKVDLSDILVYTDENTKKKILSHVNGNKNVGDLDLLVNRIYANYGDEMTAMSIEMIYLALSKYSAEEFENMTITHLADAIVKRRLYVRAYSRLLPQDTFIADKANVDRLTTAIIEIIAEKNNIKNTIEGIMGNTCDCYFYKSLQKAVQNTNSKKIKKILLNLSV